MTTDETTHGGTQWELRTAGEQMVAARHAGDVDGEVLALLRFAEGLRNSSLGVVGQVIAPLSGDMADQKRALDTMVPTVQHIAAVMAQMAAAQKRADDRDIVTDRRLATIEKRLDTKRERIDDHDARLSNHDARLEILEARDDARIATLEAEVARLSAGRADG